MRLHRRTQGRIPVRLAPTQWMITVRGLRWEGDSLTGLHRWLIVNQPHADDQVEIWRNNRCIYRGTWNSLVADPTLW